MPAPATAGDSAADATELSHTSAHTPELQLQSTSAMPAQASLQIFTLDHARALRGAWGSKDELHGQMREILDAIRSGEEETVPEVLVRDVPPQTPWRH